MRDTRIEMRHGMQHRISKIVVDPHIQSRNVSRGGKQPENQYERA